MRKYLLILLLLMFISYVIGSFEKDMKYHSEPIHYDCHYDPNWAVACYFKLSDFHIRNFDYKIKIIGIIGYREDKPADIYVTSKEKDGVPVCNPDNNWDGADYGPKEWHIKYLDLKYDDCNVYDDNWHYKKDITKFWCIYYIKVSPPPWIFTTDEHEEIINTFTWDPHTHCWSKGFFGLTCNACMHCVIVYWPDAIENTSLGVVKALFK